MMEKLVFVKKRGFINSMCFLTRETVEKMKIKTK